MVIHGRSTAAAVGHFYIFSVPDFLLWSFSMRSRLSSRSSTLHLIWLNSLLMVCSSSIFTAGNKSLVSSSSRDNHVTLHVTCISFPCSSNILSIFYSDCYRWWWWTLTCSGWRWFLATLGWRGEAALGPAAASSTQADPWTLGRNHRPWQGRRRSGNAGRVRVHSGITKESTVSKKN